MDQRNVRVGIKLQPLASGEDQRKQKSKQEAILIEENESEIDKQFDSIAKMILNARKVQISADDANDGSRGDIVKESGVIESSNMLFELRKIDILGRSILHKAALKHKSGEILKILNTLFNKRDSEGLPPVTSKDMFGNTALILACINRGASDNIRDRMNQYKVVKYLLMYRQLETDSQMNKKQTAQEQEKTNKVATTELKYFDDLYDKKIVHFSDDEYGDEAPNQVDLKVHSNSVSQYDKKSLSSIDVNSMNIHTRFSALHWACVHGTEKIVNMLLENGAHYFLPDDEGFFPIDYAGMFNHELVVKLIIQRHLRNVRDIIETIRNNDSSQSQIIKEQMKGMLLQRKSNIRRNPVGPEALRQQEIQIRKEQIKIDIRNFYLSRRKGSQLTTAWASLFFSPIFNTRLLYWGSQCNLVELSTIDEILTYLEAYPEGSVAIDRSRTPIHAAAKIGNIEKLRALLQDVKNRYQGYLTGHYVSQPQWLWELTEQEISATKYKKRNLYPISDVQMMADQVRAYGSKTIVEDFYFHLSDYRAIAAEDEKYWDPMQLHYKLPPGAGIQFSYDFGGMDKNTPLHTASQYGRVQCIQELLKMDYGLKTDIRNHNGLMPIDLISCPGVKQTYINHFKDYNQKRLALGQDPAQKPQLSASINSVAPQIQANQYSQPFANPVNEREQLVMRLMQEKEQLPQVPPFVLKISIRSKKSDVKYRTDLVNTMIQSMVKSKFQVTMFETLEQGIFFVGLQLNYSELEKEALLIQLPVKLMDTDAKKAYNPAQRKIYEPFRSKDIQLCIMSRLQRQLNLSQYQEKGIILSKRMMPMHDYSGIADINAQWYKKGPYVKQEKRTCLNILNTILGLNLLKTMPLPLIKQFFKEGSQYEYTELTAIKNYFGEKIAFHFVWMSFYTAWLIIPAIGGLGISIYHIFAGTDSIFNTIYALLVCIWVTVFIERWKRKSSEICLKWGLSDQINNNTRTERKDFRGYEYFSHDSHRVEKKTVRTRKMNIVLTFQIPVFILLLGCCIATFLGYQWIQSYVDLEDETYNSLIHIASGIVNTIIIMIFDFLYSYMATNSAKSENHKYQNTYEAAYVFKIFIFKFVNTNIQIFYQAFFYRDFDQFYYMILGMTITKSVKISFLNHIVKLVRFQFAKARYFYRIENQARNQRDQQMRYAKENPAKNEALKTPSSLANGEISGKMDETQYPVLHRHVMYAGKHEEQQRVFTDFIELNDLMIESSELDVINERSETFILFGMATLYCCACPIVPVIAIINNIIEINMTLYMNIKVKRRPWTKTAANIGPWLTIAEFMAIAAVITNCLFLFFSTDSLRTFFYRQYGTELYQQQNLINYCDMHLKQLGFLNLSSDNYYEVHLLWLIVGIEHGIIIIKQLMAACIPDSPQWVTRAILRVEVTKSQLGQEELSLERSEQLRVIEEVKKALKAQLEKKNKMMEEVQRAFSIMEERIAGNMERIKMLDQEKQEIRQQLYSNHQSEQDKVEDLKRKNREELEKVEKLNKERQLAMIKEAQKAKESEAVGSLSQYLSLSQNEWMAKERKDYLEKELNRNIQKRLIHQTFVMIEREIMANRLSKILDTKSSASNAISVLTGGLNIICAQCQKSLAILECLDCMDHFCKTCSDTLHSNHDICLDHKILQLNVSLSGQDQPKLQKWKKFEYFNFPVLADNAPFQQFQSLFYYLTHRYMSQNYIDGQTQQVNLQSLFVNKNYDILTDIQAKVMKSRDSRIFGQVTEKMLESMTCFNDEEMFYINKIAFYLFSEKGSELTFQQFTRTLGAFQSGTLQQRCNLWLHILAKEAQNSDLNAAEILDPYAAAEFIPRKHFEEVIKFSFLQRRPSDSAPTSLQTANQVIETIFKEALQQSKERNPTVDQSQMEQQLENSISSQQMWSVIERNEEVREFISCLLQFKPAPTTIQVANYMLK